MSGGFFNGFALVVGIDEYKYLGRLPRAVANDAIDVATLLSDPHSFGYRRDHVKVLVGIRATKEAIVGAIQDIATTASQNDTVLVFFSGHGARVETGDGARSYLLP